MYEKLGGEEKIRFMVDDLMEGFMGDKELAWHHRKFQDPDQMDMLKEKMFQFFKFKLGGSKRYIGISIAEVHADMNISNALFDTACEMILKSVKKIKPKPPVLREFIKMVQSLRPEICIMNPKVSELV